MGRVRSKCSGLPFNRDEVGVAYIFTWACVSFMDVLITGKFELWLWCKEPFCSGVRCLCGAVRGACLHSLIYCCEVLAQGACVNGVPSKDCDVLCLLLYRWAV